MCIRQDLGREHSILQFVTLTLDVYKVCHCVDHGVVLIKHMSESQCTTLLGHLTISTTVNCYYHVIYNNFVFQQDSAQVHLAFNAVQLMQCKTVNFLSPELRSNNIQSLTQLTVKCSQSYSSMSMTFPFFNPTTSPCTIYVY